MQVELDLISVEVNVGATANATDSKVVLKVDDDAPDSRSSPGEFFLDVSHVALDLPDDDIRRATALEFHDE